MFRKTLTGSGVTAVSILIIIILTDIIITILTFTIMAGDTLILGLAMAIIHGHWGFIGITLITTDIMDFHIIMAIIMVFMMVIIIATTITGQEVIITIHRAGEPEVLQISTINLQNTMEADTPEPIFTMGQGEGPII